MTTPQSQQHPLQPPQTQKKSDVSLAESGYGSKQSSKVELTAIKEDEQLTILNPLKISAEGEVPIITECTTHSVLGLNITGFLPGVQDLRRGSEESNPSCSSNASTPASTKPLLSAQSRQHSDNFKSNLALKLDKSTPKQALQMPKPSDLMKSWECTPKTYADEITLRETVRCEMPEFVKDTDIEELAPLLYSKKLLHSGDYAKLRSIPSDKQRGNHFYMEILPRKGRHTYRRLYECLKKETEHLGHRDLVRILDKALRDRKPPQNSSDSSPTESNHPESTDSHAIQCKHCCTVL